MYKTYEVQTEVEGNYRFNVRFEEDIVPTIDDTDFGYLDMTSYTIDDIEEVDDGFDVLATITGTYIVPNYTNKYPDDFEDDIDQIVQGVDFGPLTDLRVIISSRTDVTFEEKADYMFDYSRD